MILAFHSEKSCKVERKKWTDCGRWHYKQKSKIGTVRHAHFFYLAALTFCLAFAPAGHAQEVITSPQVTSPAPKGEGARFSNPARSEVRLPRNADRAAKAEVQNQKSPFNPKFGMPQFEPESQYSSAAMSKGGTATARGTELTRFVPVEIKEDRKKPIPIEPAGPTPDQVRMAEQRKKQLFDEIYMAKTNQPPLTFESTQDQIPLGPNGMPVPTRNVGERTLKQYVPLTNAKGKVKN